MIGQLTFYFCHFYVLIDSSITHSFITRGIIERLGIEPTYVDDICIKMSDGDKILSNQMLLGKTMSLRGKYMTTNLVVLDMLNFNVILDMDFLSYFEAKINCRKKKVRFYLDENDEFTFDEGKILSLMISSIKAKKLLSKGYIRYLAHVMSKDNN